MKLIKSVRLKHKKIPYYINLYHIKEDDKYRLITSVIRKEKHVIIEENDYKNYVDGIHFYRKNLLQFFPFISE